MFPRVLYLDQDKALELDWFGLGSLQTRHRYGVVRRAQPHQKHVFLEIIRLFQAQGQPVHPSNPRCSRLMAEFANMLAEPPDGLAWQALLQANLRDVAQGFAEADSAVSLSSGPNDVVNEAARDTECFMIQASAAVGAMPKTMLTDPFIMGAIASHTAIVLQHLTNGQCSPAIADEAAIAAVQLTFSSTPVSKEEAARALRDHRSHTDYHKAKEVVSLILAARFGHSDGASKLAVDEMRNRVRAMPRAIRDALGTTEQEQVTALLSQERFVKPLKQKYGELWRKNGA